MVRTGDASCAGQCQDKGDEIEEPRSGLHQRRGLAERVAPLSHLWTARRSCHGRPGALPTGLPALTPARRLPWMGFLSLGFRRGRHPRGPSNCGRDPRRPRRPIELRVAEGDLHRTSEARNHRASTGVRPRAALFSSLLSFPTEKKISCPEPAHGRRACGGVRPVSCRAGPARNDCSAQVTGRATIHRQHVVSRPCRRAESTARGPHRGDGSLPGACARASGRGGGVRRR